MRGVRAATLAVLMLLLTSTATLARDGDASNVGLDARLFTGLPYRIAHQPPYAYVALDTGVQVFDVSDSAAPRPIGEIYLPSPAFDLIVVGPLVYVANGESGLAIVDVADPALPVVVGRLRMPVGSFSEARGISLVGSLAVVAESSVPGTADYGVRVIDVTTATAPMQLGHMPLDNGALTVAQTGTHAFVGLGSDLAQRSGMVVVDISTPAAPFEIPASFLRTAVAVNRIALDGTVAFLAVGDRSVGSLTAVSIAVPALPFVLDEAVLPNGAMDVGLLPGVAYVAVQENGLRRFATGTPSNLLPSGGVTIGQSAIAAAPRGDVAFVGLRSSNGSGALAVVATPTPGLLRLEGAWSHAEATAVASGRSLGYLLRRDALHVFDTSSPSSPIQLGVWQPPGGDFSSLAVDAGIAAVAHGRSVHLVSVTTPTAPSALGSVTLSSGYAVRVALDAGVLFVVTGLGLETFDVSTPVSPVPLATLATSSWSADIAVDGLLAYLLAGSDFIVLDLTVPSAPTPIATLNVPGAELIGVAARGAVAVATGRSALLYTIDLTTPASPILATTLGAGRRGNAVTLIGDRAVIAAGREGVRVVDISNPTVPLEEGWYDASGEAVSLASDGQVILLATTAAQHWLLQCQTCTPTCVEQWPDIAQNSLKVVKQPSRDTFTWTFVSALAGDTNLHTTNVKTAITNLWMDMSSRVQRTSSLTLLEPFDPPAGAPQFYRVFGAGACVDLSYWP